MKIWCLFSVENHYDQPNNNLVCWWKDKPPFEVLLSAIGGEMSNTDSILVAANLMQDSGNMRLDNIDYRLEQVAEGVKL